MNQVLRTLFAILAFLPFSLSAQTTSTLALPGSGMDDDMLLDSAGNIFAAGYDNGNVYRVTPSGAVSLYATGFSAANGLEWDHLGNLLVCDNTGDAIYKVAPDSSISLFISINSPSGITRDPLSDTLYFTSYLGHSVYKLAPDSTLILFAQGSPLNGPVGLDWDKDNNLLVGNFGNGVVHRVNRSGNVSHIGTFPMSGATGFIAYKDGYIYGTRFQANRIYRMDTLGNTELVAGSLNGQIDGPVSVARFNRPNGIIFSRGGDSLFVTDYGAKSIRVITDLDSIGIVGIDDQEGMNISLNVFPNPAHDKIKVDFDLPLLEGNAMIRMVDNFGREVLRREVKASDQQSIQLEVSNLATGQYYLILNADEIQLTQKVMVE